MDRLQRMTRGKIPGPETGIEIRKSICAICDPVSQCGLDCYVKDGRVIKVEGSLDHPQNKGSLCAKGQAQRQWVYHEDRLQTPVKRVGPRGSRQFVPISWGEALDTIADRLERIKAESGPESVVFYVGYPKHPRPFLQRLSMLYGSPNYCTESSACNTAAVMAWRSMYGQGSAPDVANTTCLFVLGRNPFHGNGLQSRQLLDAKERGVKFIVADPRLTPLASRADIHLQLRPGTDGALVLAMANVIISEGLHDREFVARWTRGFDEYRQYAAEFTLERAEKITGVPAAKIRGAAILYASSRPAAMMPSSSPVVHHVHGVQYERATLALIGLTGNFDIPGGNRVSFPSWLHVSGAGFTTREHEFEMPRPWSDLPPRLGQTRFPVWTDMVDECQSMDFQRQAASRDPYPMKGFVGFGLNYRLWPDSAGFLAALDKLDFVVDVDLFLTDSATHADIVLPTCSSIERSELRCYPQKYIVYTTPVIEPLGEARSDFDIIFALADKLGLDYQVQGGEKLGGYLPNGAPDFREAVEASFDWMLQPSGMTIADLKPHPGGMSVPNPTLTAPKSYEQTGFETPSGKMEFSSSILEKYSDRPGIAGLPLYAEPPYSPLSSPELAKDYPFVLCTGARLPMFVHSRLFRLPWSRSLRPDAAADLNPADARSVGVAQGDLIEVYSPHGSIRVRANLTDLVRPGDVHMLHGYPEADVNTLLEADYLDPISGFPGYKAALCAVRKAAPDDTEGREAR